MKIKYIFCISTGRSGSNYLSNLFKQAENTVSVHEAVPLMNSRAMQRFNQGDETELRALMPFKMAAILRKNKFGKKVYCETNHSYIQGWGNLVPDVFIPRNKIGIVNLSRDPEKVACSMLKLHDVPGASEWSRTWYLDPHARRNLTRPPKDADALSLCRWYVEEIRSRAEDYRKKFSGITYFDCSLKELNDPCVVHEMFRSFGLNEKSCLLKNIGRTVNQRSDWQVASIEDLTAPPQYPSPDLLSSVEKDYLNARMISYLTRTHAKEIDRIKPYIDQEGYVAFYWITGLVFKLEPELEKKFHYSLKFTETEWVLIGELFHSINPHGSLPWSFSRRSASGVHYIYDFNAFSRLMFLGNLLRSKLLDLHGSKLAPHSPVSSAMSNQDQKLGGNP